LIAIEGILLSTYLHIFTLFVILTDVANTHVLLLVLYW